MSHSLAQATIWNLAGYFYLIIASFISTPILIRALGLSNFSQYAIILAILSLASAVDLGLVKATIWRLAHYTKISRQLTTLNTSFYLFNLVGLLVAIIGGGVLWRFNLHSSLIMVVSLSVFTEHLLAFYQTLIQADNRFDLYNLKTFILGTARTIFSAYLAFIGSSLTTIFIWQLFALILVILLTAFYTHRRFHFLNMFPSFIVAKQLLNYGFKNQLGKLSNQLSVHYGKFFLLSISPLAVSAYAIARNLINKLTASINQFTLALFPVSSKKTNFPFIYQLYYRLEALLFGLSILGVGLYHFFGYSFLSWWLNDQSLVNAVHSVMQILVWYLVLIVLTPIPATLLDSINKPELTSILSLSTVIIELSLTWLLLPQFQLLAPAYASLISLIIMLPILFLTLHRQKKLLLV